MNISFTCTPFCKIEHFVQLDFKNIYILNFIFKMGFFNILNIKWKIIIMLIIVRKQILFSIH